MQLETVGGTLQGMAEPLHVPNFVAALRELPLYREMSGMTAWRWNRGDLPEFAKYLLAYPELAAALAEDAVGQTAKQRAVLRQSLGRKGKK